MERIIKRPRDLLVRDGWPPISRKIDKGERPTVADLVAALRRQDEAVPGKVQLYIAALLSGELERRGRPALTPDRAAKRALALVSRIDSYAAEFSAPPRKRNPKGLAFQKVAAERKWEVETVKRKYIDAKRTLRSSSSMWAAFWLARNEGDGK